MTRKLPDSAMTPSQLTLSYRLAADEWIANRLGVDVSDADTVTVDLDALEEHGQLRTPVGVLLTVDGETFLPDLADPSGATEGVLRQALREQPGMINARTRYSRSKGGWVVNVDVTERTQPLSYPTEIEAIGHQLLERRAFVRLLPQPIPPGPVPGIPVVESPAMPDDTVALVDRIAAVDLAAPPPGSVEVRLLDNPFVLPSFVRQMAARIVYPDGTMPKDRSPGTTCESIVSVWGNEIRVEGVQSSTATAIYNAITEHRSRRAIGPKFPISEADHAALEAFERAVDGRVEATEPNHYTVVVALRGFPESTDALADRVRRTLETHPTLSLRVDEVVAKEALPPGVSTYLVLGQYPEEGDCALVQAKDEDEARKLGRVELKYTVDDDPNYADMDDSEFRVERFGDWQVQAWKGGWSMPVTVIPEPEDVAAKLADLLEEEAERPQPIDMRTSIPMEIDGFTSPTMLRYEGLAGCGKTRALIAYVNQEAEQGRARSCSTARRCPRPATAGRGCCPPCRSSSPVGSISSAASAWSMPWSRGRPAASGAAPSASRSPPAPPGRPWR